MCPYIVKVGQVRSGEDHFGVGAVLPDGIGDEAMVEAGAVEFVAPEPKKPAKPVAKPQPKKAAVRKAVT